MNGTKAKLVLKLIELAEGLLIENRSQDEDNRTYPNLVVRHEAQYQNAGMIADRQSVLLQPSPEGGKSLGRSC